MRGRRQRGPAQSQARLGHGRRQGRHVRGDRRPGACHRQRPRGREPRTLGRTQQSTDVAACTWQPFVHIYISPYLFLVSNPCNKTVQTKLAPVTFTLYELKPVLTYPLHDLQYL